MIKIMIERMYENPIIHLLILAMIADTLFGLLRAWKQHSFNSSLGINGGIRKIGMLVGILFLFMVDHIIQINMAFMIPLDWLAVLHLEQIGTTEFFGILFILYEAISILKNMLLLGVPAPKWLKDHLEEFLQTMTSEIPNEESSDTKSNPQEVHNV